MDQYELWMLRLKDKQNEFIAIPEWAKAEQLERCFPQCDIWPDNKTGILGKLLKLFRPENKRRK